MKGGQIAPMTNAFIQTSGVFAELELRIIRDRVRSGMANARAKGRKIGRPQVTADDIPAAFLRHYPAYKIGKMNLSELARICGLSRTTAYKYIGLLEGEWEFFLFIAVLISGIICGNIKKRRLELWHWLTVLNVKNKFQNKQKLVLIVDFK